jgi:NAD(P)-dependent dehydrogenase (short-subunit alcohol dehydrogenase family)
MLQSFGAAPAILIIGDGGIGRALGDFAAAAGATVHRRARADGIAPDNEPGIAAAVAGLRDLAAVIVATGVLHRDGRSPERDWRQIDAGWMAENFAANAILPALVAKHALPLLRRGQKAVFAALSARVGSIGDNRLGGWHSYRASKAALNQIIRTLAHELARKNPTALAVCLHPGTVDSAMSRPFQRGVAPEKLFTPAISAAHLWRVLDTLTAADTGSFHDWAGKPIPW